MIWPFQRGGWDAANAEPGDDTCFQPKQPCGEVAIPSATTGTITGGVTLYVAFQQNLNHYNPGFPGFIDVAYAQGPNHNSDDEFTVLAQIPDYWPHLQAQQTNFSVPVLFPNISCPWCTIRIRYHPNKPSEPIFHQCGDITINLNINSNVFNRRVFGFFQSSPHDYLGTLGEVSSSGQVASQSLSINVFKKRNNNIPTGKRQKFSDQFLSSGLVSPSYDTSAKEIYFIGDDVTSFEQGNSPDILYKFNYDTQQFSAVRSLAPRSGRQWVSLLRTKAGFIGIQHLKTPANSYQFVVSTITPDGVVKDIGSTPVNSTFVNFFWAEYNPLTNQVHLLTGDEDSLFTLDVVMYTISISTGASSVVMVDNSQYTITDFHVNPITGRLYAVSPGLFGKINWHLVTVNPASGAVTAIGAIPDSEQWVSKYGGGVYNGLSQDGKYLMHTFTWVDTGATALAVLDTSSGDLLYFTDINRGVNNDQRLTGLIAI